MERCREERELNIIKKLLDEESARLRVTPVYKKKDSHTRRNGRAGQPSGAKINGALTDSPEKPNGVTVNASERAATQRRKLPLPAPNFNVRRTTWQGSQVCKGAKGVGRVVGAPFSATPSHIEFDGCQSSNTYSTIVTLTNTSGQVNSFRLVSVPLELENFLEVKFQAPGRMSAGLVSNLHITFTCPDRPISDFINQRIYFKAEFGGEFSIPLRCTFKELKS